MASHTTLARLPARPARKAVAREAHIPDAALPCRRRPDVFQHPLLDNSEHPHGLHGPDTPMTAAPGIPPDQRRQHLVLLRTARDLCASCPLWAECLQDAVAYAEPYGYTAATTREDRRALRRILDLGDENGDLPAHAAVRFDSGSLPRRLTRLRSRADESSATHSGNRRPTTPDLPELERILDAFDQLQSQLADSQSLLRKYPPRAALTSLLQSHTTTQPTHRQTTPPGGPSYTSGPSNDRSEEPMAAAEAGQRITFSYEDPALAVRQAVLGPLVRSALPALTSLEQLVTMLTCMPGGDTGPEAPRDIPAVRQAVESLLPDHAEAPSDADGTPLAPRRPLTGSVSVELATTDPVSALRRDFLEPLLRELAATLANIEKVATMLAAASDDTGDAARLETIRTAVREIHDRLPHPAAPTAHPAAHALHGGHPLAGTAAGAGAGAGPAQTRRTPSTPSIRAAVEKAVAGFPGAFSARDVLRALPSGIYGDPSKTISNVLSALVKSGRLQRLSRGTYARVLNVVNIENVENVQDIDDALLPERGEAKSA
ncbi:WhiB family transcriptional regulator [Streptomyces caniscabiei]|uniref:WhiB family transcriptional regulator n=1 Tax=Streptomyces caniscabiei TaxID=2746961 RepID=A0ABU4MJ03_9ACTN|nr:WhiB family transcriptional regulator [Streptomyces caniscabiei]MBE4735146.1 WhiB family transcriptional regulator [Streptomyces caniscabiei]MBE4754280.1 WhiB family transcriptional regulator [Streptomyces caniscabiei]MBE4767872.1 WhiB family transcriptional regulator [Streptomyces caniscabiei]MBE4784328.1 WhiB family transcriptional regulator [Streptomyces caniscabiei]MBE4791173.1 WhiB family transcriptional regulator [Streptomyces caniscabiei]